MHTVRRRTILVAAAVLIITAASLLLQPFRNSGLTSFRFAPHSAHAQTDPRAVGNVVIQSNVVIQGNANRVVSVTRDPPSETAYDNRIFRNEADEEGFPSNRDNHGNGYAQDPASTITGLSPGFRYKSRLRARYNGTAGPWTEAIEFTVPAPSPATTTSTLTPAGRRM